MLYVRSMSALQHIDVFMFALCVLVKLAKTSKELQNGKQKHKYYVTHFSDN